MIWQSRATGPVTIATVVLVARCIGWLSLANTKCSRLLLPSEISFISSGNYICSAIFDYARRNLLLATLFIFYHFFNCICFNLSVAHSRRNLKKCSYLFIFFYSSTHTLFQCFSVNYNLVFSISNFFNFLWEVMKKWRYEKKKREGDRLEFFERQTKFINLIRSFFLSFLYFFTSSLSRKHRNDKMKLLSPWYFDNKV